MWGFTFWGPVGAGMGGPGSATAAEGGGGKGARGGGDKATGPPPRLSERLPVPACARMPE